MNETIINVMVDLEKVQKYFLIEIDKTRIITVKLKRKIEYKKFICTRKCQTNNCNGSIGSIVKNPVIH